MKQIKLLFAATTLALCPASACAQQGTSPEAPTEVSLEALLLGETAGCMEGPLAQFGNYLGDWDMQDWQLSQDGTTWTEGNGARWIFSCVGNGVAVQDFWMPNSGGFGTNLRMYNPTSESWDIAWTAASLPGMTHINAKQDDDGKIVMRYVSPPQTPDRRITFFPPTETGWDWILEISQDQGETWIGVYKMTATKRP